MQENTTLYSIKDELSLDKCVFLLTPGDRVFFYGDLGAGKSTFIRYLLRKNLKNPNLTVRSPTYTYYEKYSQNPSIYHCDLYRIEDYSTFVSIGGEEIAENRENIMLIEWPELIEGYIEPTKIVKITLGDNGERQIEITGV